MLGLDKWLNRIALLSQILLVIIAIVTVKLTVIPLYQKELSSEELAKAQIQLGSVQSKINELTSNVSAKENKLNITVSRLREVEKAEGVSRENLSALNRELGSQGRVLAELKKQNKKITDESSRLKGALISENQLKFRQALEWFALVTDIGRDCYNLDRVELFVSKEDRKAETAKGCGPHANVQNGIETLRKVRNDSSGDPLTLPDGTLDKWLSLAEIELAREKFHMQSVYEPSVFKSLDFKNLVRKDRESNDEFRARVVAMQEARSDYASRSRSRDHDIAKRFIRNIKLPM